MDATLSSDELRNPNSTLSDPYDDGSNLGSPVESPNGPAKKKKKKKKPKPKDPVATLPVSLEMTLEPRQPVLCISRNKHWRYISSYHGPWLQLPLELLESLFVLNLDPNNFIARDERLPSPPNGRRTLTAPIVPISKPLPPPIDPGVFRSVSTIRRLIDEASDLAVRAASGLSAAALGSMRSPGAHASPWATAQSLGINPMGDQGSGRTISMSSTRTHRLRVLAVQKLAAAYKADEIAASVMVMQGASALDDLAERVLKVDPNDQDARYVHFFHEKIPSRQLAESTTTEVLDKLIEAQPTHLEFFRTRGIVHCFRDEYTLAVKDFTHALKESRASRRARAAHNAETDHRPKIGKSRKKSNAKSNGQAPPSGTSVPDALVVVEEAQPPSPILHPSVGPDAPDPLEPQAIFLRAAAFLQHAVFLIEETILRIEGVHKIPAQDAMELKLSLMEFGRYGGVVTDDPRGPLGSPDGERLRAYRAALGNEQFRDNIATLLRKCIRDHEKFMTYFDTVDGTLPSFGGDLAQRVEAAFLLSESLRPGSHSQPPPMPENPGIFTSYHPLLVESHFSILLSYLLLGDFVSLLPAYQRAASVIDGLEGYPVFLPARSMAQAEFVEILERLVGGWASGIQPHSLSQIKKRLAIEAPPAIEHAKYPGEVADSTGSSRTPSPATDETHVDDTSAPGKADDKDRSYYAANLDCARILLAPVLARRRVREEREAAESATEPQRKKPLSINIPLHGPRVDIVLAYIGAVYLPDFEAVA